MIFSRIPKNTYVIAIACALVAAVGIGMKIPLTKLVLGQGDALSTMAFMYLGVLIGMSLIAVCGRKTSLIDPQRHLQKKDTPLLLILILLGTTTTILINLGLLTTSATTGTVLNNFTLVATALLAFFIFKEKISKRLWIAIVFITLGVMILSIGDITAFSLTPGSLLIVGGTLCYGFANNIMKKVSDRNPVETSIVRSFGITLLSFVLMLFFGSTIPSLSTIIFMMVTGFLTSGLYFLFILYAQRKLGVAKTAALTGIYPLLGIIASIIIFSEIPNLAFGAALLLIIPGLFFAITRNKDIAVEEEEIIPQTNDESSLLTGMNENTKRDARNYITAFGFLAIATYFIYNIFEVYIALESGIRVGFDSLLTTPEIVIGLFSLICSILLFILRKRALVATTLMFTSVQIFADALLPNDSILLSIFCIFSFILAAVLLLSKDKMKYIFSGICAVFGLISLSWIFSSTTSFFIISGIITLLFTLFLTYVTIACASDKHNLPLTQFLMKDEDTTIRTCGQMLGYVFIAMYFIIDAVYGVFNVTVVDNEMLQLIRYTLILMLFLCGVLLLFVGKMRFTPVLFIGISFALWLDCICTGYFYYVAIFVLLIIGVLAVLRKYSRLLPSLLTIFCSFNMTLYNFYYQGVFDLKTAIIILGIACALLALYLAVATFSEVKKLPLF